MIFIFIFIEFLNKNKSKIILFNYNLFYCVNLILQPRYFKYKKKNKNRKFNFFKINNLNYWKKLNFGSTGLITINTLFLTSNSIFRLTLFLKKSVRKQEYTSRKFWIFSFPHIPLTKKPTGTRMGKGKGKLECWFIKTNPGITLVEFKNLRFGRSKYFSKQLSFKLGIKTKFVFIKNNFISLPFFKNKKINFSLKW